MLYPPEGGKRVAYSRPSTMAKWLDDKGGLLNWKASMAMIGMSKSKPLQARVAAIVARTEVDAYRENKGALKEIVETATQVAQAQGRADLGTAFHEFTEMHDNGTLDPSYVPESFKGPLDAYIEATDCLTVIDTEVFVTLDTVIDGKKVRGAGSLDRLVQYPGIGVLVGDVKTGTDEPKYPLGATTQVAIYARGERYRDETLPGSPPFTDGVPNPDGTAWRKPLHPMVRTDVGLLIHCPLEKVRGKFVCDLYALDLERGWDSLVLGHRVQSGRRLPTLKKLEKL